MKRFLVSVCASACCLAAAAQQRQTLSFEEALRRTMTDNPAVQAARYEEEAARRERQAAVGLHFPTVSVGGAYTYLGSDVALDLDLLALADKRHDPDDDLRSMLRFKLEDRVAVVGIFVNDVVDYA